MFIEDFYFFQIYICYHGFTHSFWTARLRKVSTEGIEKDLSIDFF